MKIIVSLLVSLFSSLHALCMLSIPLVAQDTPRPFEVGISTMISSSMNTVTPPRGWRIEPMVHSLPDVFVSTVLPLWRGGGVSLDMGLTSSGVRCSSSTSINESYIYSMRYASVSPGIVVGNFFAGVGVHLPISARRQTWDASQSLESVTIAGKDVSLRSQVSTMLDIRAGVVLPLIEDEHGIVSGLLSCSYQVSSFFTAPDASGSILYNQPAGGLSYDPAVLHVRAGLRYLFSFFGSSESDVADPATQSPISPETPPIR